MAALATIAREMLPTTDLVIKAAIRAMIGAGLFVVASALPSPLATWVEFAGKFSIMLCVITLLGHAETVFCAHAADWIRARMAAAAGMALMVAVMPIVVLMMLSGRASETWRHDDCQEES